MSRLLDASAIEEVQALEWMPAGSTGSPGPQQSSAPAKPSAVHRESSPSQPDVSEQMESYRRRIGELEQMLAVQVREAREQGLRSGRAEGAEQAQRELEPVIARLAHATEEIAGIRRKVRGEAEEDAMRLAVAIARKVLFREITVDPDALLGLVKAAMQRLNARDVHRLRLHPEDVAAVERHLSGSAPLDVVADASLERGDVVFETTRGNLDASIGTQLAEIERGFVDVLRRNRDAVS